VDVTSVSLRRPKSAWNLLRTMVRNVVDEIAAASKGVRRADLWRDDPKFMALLDEVSRRSQLNPVKLYALYQFACNAATVSGDVAELGVFRGGSARLLARTLPQKTLHLFDTFQGMPFHDASKDLHVAGDFRDTSRESVGAFLTDCGNVAFHVGMFADTMPQVAARRFAFVHVDADLYDSVKQCCEFFYPRLASGGIMLFDDYGFVSCPGAREAVDQFFAGKPETPIYLATGQSVVIRNRAAVSV